MLLFKQNIAEKRQKNKINIIKLNNSNKNYQKI